MLGFYSCFSKHIVINKLNNYNLWVGKNVFNSSYNIKSIFITNYYSKIKINILFYCYNMLLLCTNKK